MIDPKELRIGNYVYPAYSGNIKGDETKVVANDILKCEAGVYFLNPIPLTEEWLLKLGFTKQVNYAAKVVESYTGLGVNNTYLWISDKSILPDDVLLCVTLIQDGNKFFIRENNFNIKYVHQLQNLYFALTGEELTTATADPQQ